jgi:hypothetical protein
MFDSKKCSQNRNLAMQHPFELKIEDLHTIDFELIDLTSADSAQVVGGDKGGSGITADGVGPNEVGGPDTAPVPTDPGTITADGVGPNEVGGPFTPGPGMATTLAIGEEGGGDYFPRHGGRHHRKPRYHW